MPIPGRASWSGVLSPKIVSFLLTDHVPNEHALEVYIMNLKRHLSNNNTDNSIITMTMLVLLIIVMTILWMNEILHHFETTGNYCLLVCTWESSFQGYSGGAGFHPSTVLLPNT